MREFAVAARIEIDGAANLADAVFANAAAQPDKVAIRRHDAGGWTDITACEFAAAVVGLGKGLIASGISAGDRVAIMSRTRYEWTLLDYALWSIGALGIPVYDTSAAEQIAWIAADSGSVALLAETGEHAERVRRVRDRLPKLRSLWCLQDGDLDAVRAAGAALPDSAVHERRAALRADDLATIIYTSGTTGRPKGCELTHRQLLFEVITDVQSMPQLFAPDASTLLFLPIAHVLGRVVQCALVHQNLTFAHTPDTTTLLPDLAEFAPTFLLAVPRVFEKLYFGARHRAHSAGRGKIFDAADSTAVAYSEAMDAGRVPATLRARHALFDKLVYAKLRAALGGRCTRAISGGAPLGERLLHFFRGIGVLVYEGYGLTETAAAACLNRDGAMRIGTVGRPLPGVAVRIADDGEILIRGGMVFSRYWNDPQATAEAIVDGWFRTGDTGRMDDGFLQITGRKKEIIVTAGGKNVSPAPLQDKLRSHPLVSQSIVVGDGKPYVAALITLDPESLARWSDGATPSFTDSRLVAEIQRAVDAANELVSRAEGIRKFTILETEFTEESGELSPKQEIRRQVIVARYRAQIEEIYATDTREDPSGQRR